MPSLELAQYQSVIWLAGEESTADESFDDEQQTLLRGYWEAGGTLWTSGSEVLWDLDYRGTESDRAFAVEVLGAAMADDDAATDAADVETAEEEAEEKPKPRRARRPRRRRTPKAGEETSDTSAEEVAETPTSVPESAEETPIVEVSVKPSPSADEISEDETGDASTNADPTDEVSKPAEPPRRGWWPSTCALCWRQGSSQRRSGSSRRTTRRRAIRKIWARYRRDGGEVEAR